MQTPRIIVALDSEHSKELVNNLNPNDCLLKIGQSLFIQSGPEFVKNLVSRGFKIFFRFEIT